MSFAEQRFDSRSAPLFKFFSLFPFAVKTLARLTKDGDNDDRAWATSLLREFAGTTGYDKLVSAAVVADAMVVSGVFINLEQATPSSAPRASRSVFRTIRSLC